MKKNILIILFAFLCLKVNAQKIELPLKDSDVVYEEVVKLKDTTVSSDKLFSLAQTWFANTFKDSKSVLQVNDRQSLKLIGKGVVLFTKGFGNTLDTYVYYTVAVDIKQGRYRYRVYNIGFETGNSIDELSKGYSHYLHGEIHRIIFESKKAALKRYENDFTVVNTKINNLIISLKSNMNNLNADNF
jgi:hypothetical protein